MARCGCSGRCGCVLNGDLGISIEGLGNPNDPYQISFDGEDVTGSGLGWDSVNRRLNVRISGTGLGFDGTGALVNTGGGGDGGVGVGPTVDNLITRDRDVLGGLHGGGYLIKPAQLRRSYEYGLERGLDVIHIPVRFLRDGTPVVHIAEFTGKDNLSWNGPIEPVQEQDIHRWRILALEPGMWNPRQAHQPDNTEDPLVGSNWVQTHWHNNSPRHGWFGYQEENQYGMSTLDDVLRLCAGWVCVVINLRWPARSGTTGAFTNPTPEYRTSRFLTEVLRLIDKYRVVSSAIVASDQKTIPGGGTTGEVSVFERFYNRGIACGMWLETPAAANLHPPGATWDTRATFAFPHVMSGLATLQGYVNDGKQVIAHPVTRQYLRPLVNDSGCLGVLSGDPEYYGGAIASNLSHGNYRYRKDASTWHYDTIDHGLLPPDDTVVTACRNEIRGYHTVTSNDLFLGAGATHNSSDHYVLQGWMCPVSNATDYTLDLTMGWDGAMPGAVDGLYLALAFGLVTDAAFQDWEPFTVPSSDPGYSGYTFAHGSNGFTNLQAWDGSARVSLSPPLQMVSPSALIHRYRIGINSRGIRVTEWSLDGNTQLKELANSTSTLAKSHRGGYIHFGRTAPNGNQAIGRFGAPKVLPGTGNTYGPA